MTNFDFAKCMGEIDKDIIEQADNASIEKNGNRSWHRWAAMAASFALVLLVSIYFSNSNAPLGPGTVLPSSSEASIPNSQINVEQGVCVEGKLYMPDAELSQNATQENVGSIVGYVSFDNITILDIPAFEYLPKDGKTNRIIVFINDGFYVYSFYSYIPDETENWPGHIVSGAACVEIRDPNYGITNEIVYASISDVDGIINFLCSLTPKYSRTELNEYYFNKFKNQFREGEIWINESGEVTAGGNTEVSVKFSDLVSGESRNLVVIMEDNTRLVYRYCEGAGVILIKDFGYILSDEQIEQINHFVGLA